MAVGPRSARPGGRAIYGYARGAPGAATARQDVGRETLSEHAVKSERLRINEIFHSLQGEADCVGFPTVFVRLTGCPLRCQYCDTEYAFHAGEWFDLDAILLKVRELRGEARLRDGRRAPGAAELPEVARASVRCRICSIAGDQRRARCGGGRSARFARDRREDARPQTRRRAIALRISRIYRRATSSNS